MTLWLLLLHLLPPLLLQILRKNSHINTWGVLHFGARGGCLFGGRTNPHTGLISSKTTRICPLAGNSNPCQFSKSYTPRSTTGPLLSGVTTGYHIPWPHNWGGALWVSVLGDNAASLQLALFEPSNPSDSPPRIQELWVNTMFSLLLMSNSTTL